MLCMGGRRDSCRVLVRGVKEITHLKDIGVDGRLILK